MNREIPWSEPRIIQHTKLLLKSFNKCTGESLLEEILDDASNSFLLYHASFVVVSFGVEQDPGYNYANLKAQEIWETDWEQFTSTPLRLVEEETGAAERLEEEGRKGFISNYSGVLRSDGDKRFIIKDATLWNLVDESGRHYGQAAIFSNGQFL